MCWVQVATYLLMRHIALHLVLEVKSCVEAVPTDTSQYLALAGHIRDEQFDWWSKFYASLQDPNLKQKEYDELQLDKLVVRLKAVNKRICVVFTAVPHMVH